MMVYMGEWQINTNHQNSYPGNATWDFHAFNQAGKLTKQLQIHFDGHIRRR